MKKLIIYINFSVDQFMLSMISKQILDLPVWTKHPLR